MFGSLYPALPPPPLEAQPLTRHEYGQLADEFIGLCPMTQAYKPLRQPPPFPLAAYLVMVQGK